MKFMKNKNKDQIAESKIIWQGLIQVWKVHKDWWQGLPNLGKILYYLIWMKKIKRIDKGLWRKQQVEDLKW